MPKPSSTHFVRNIGNLSRNKYMWTIYALRANRPLQTQYIHIVDQFFSRGGLAKRISALSHFISEAYIRPEPFHQRSVYPP